MRWSARYRGARYTVTRSHPACTQSFHGHPANGTSCVGYLTIGHKSLPSDMTLTTATLRDREGTPGQMFVPQ